MVLVMLFEKVSLGGKQRAGKAFSPRLIPLFASERALVTQPSVGPSSEGKSVLLSSRTVSVSSW